MDSIDRFPDPVEPPAPSARLGLDPPLPPAPEFSGGTDARRPLGAGTGGGPPQPPPPTAVQAHVVDYLKVLSKHRRIAFGVFVLVFGSVLAHTFTTTPLFEARTQVLIENEQSNVVNFDEVVEQNRLTADYYQTQYRILQSRALARKTLDTSKAWDHPLLSGSGDSPSITSPVAFARSMLSGLVSLVRGSGSEASTTDETAAQSAVIDRFLAGLRVTPVRNTRLVEVRFRSASAQLSADMANAHSKAYIDQNLEIKYQASREANDWLETRMTEQRQKLEQTEQQLQQYRENTDAVSLEDRQNIVVQRLADLNAAVTRARTDRIQKEANYKQLVAIQGDLNALDSYPAILTNLFIQQLKSQLTELQRQRAQMADKLGERHPDMVKQASAMEVTERRLAGEIQKVVLSVKNEVDAALAQERQLMAALDQQKNDAIALNRTAIGYGALQRDAESNRQLFQGLLQRTRETGITSDLKTNNLRLVDAAEVPRSASYPNKSSNLMLGFLAGLVLGVCVAFLFDYLDNRIKTPEEIRDHLRIPFLGIVPIIPNDRSEGTPVLTEALPANFAEAFRGVRSNVMFSSTDEGCKTIAVTSTGPGEGKTVVAANTAVLLAQAGMRVLLIDCDMRRPQIHDAFKMPQEPGLSNVMVGNVKAADAIKKTKVATLWTLSAGKLPPNPAELLGSKRFAEFLKALSEHFDWIVLDTPPVLAVTDAQILSHISTGVMFVVGSEMTSRGAARTALEQLDHAGARYVGAVLNRVDLQRNSYYYSHYYRRDYARYHATSPTA